MKIPTYLTLPGSLRAYYWLKAAVLLTLSSLSVLPTLAQTSNPIEIRLQPGETTTQPITVTNPSDASVNFQTKFRETLSSQERRTVPPASFDDLNVVYSTGFEDYDVGDLGLQKGWLDVVRANPDLTFTRMPVDGTISTADPLNGNKHVAYGSQDTTYIYDSFSPMIEAEQTSPIRSVVANMRLTGLEGSQFDIGTYRRVPGGDGKKEPDADLHVALPHWPNVVGYIKNEPGYVGGAYFNRYSSQFDKEKYFELMIVANRITKTVDLYFDGRRIAEKVPTIHGVVDGIVIRGWNNNLYNPQSFGPVGPSLHIDDITIADGDASAPTWISTITTSGTLPAQGERTLDVSVSAQDLGPGTYEAEVQVLDEAFGTVSTVPVTLIVEEPPVNPVVEKLNLTSMCSNNPDTLLRWRIRNPNDFAVDVTWQVYGSTQSATVSAPAGDSFFFTQTEAGANTTIIRWKDEEGRNRQKIKASGKAACDPANARVASNPKLKVYPTPVSDQLNVAVEGTTGGALSIYDQTGRVVYRGSISPDSPLQLNAQALQLQPRRIYVVSVQTPTQRVVRKIMIE